MAQLCLSGDSTSLQYRDTEAQSSKQTHKTMPFSLINLAGAERMESQRIKDVNELPPFFYRVQYWGAKTEHFVGEGFRASFNEIDLSDTEFRIAITRQLEDRLWSDEGRETPAELCGLSDSSPPEQHLASPLISVFSDKDDAKRWAWKQSRRTRSNCLITEIDTQKLNSTGVWKFDVDLLKAMEIDPNDSLARDYVMRENCDEKEATYFLFHRLRTYPMVRMFWWGPNPVHRDEHEDVEYAGRWVMCDQREVPAKFSGYDKDLLEEAIAEDFEWDSPREIRKFQRLGADHPRVQHMIMIKQDRERERREDEERGN